MAIKQLLHPRCVHAWWAGSSRHAACVGRKWAPLLGAAQGKGGVQERQRGCRMLLGYQLVGLSRVVALLGAKLSVSVCFPSALGH